MIVMFPLPITLATRRFLFYWGNPSWSITCNCYWEGEHRKVSSTEFFGFRPLFFWVYIQYAVPQMPFLTPRWPRASSHFKKWRWTNWVSMICVKKVWQNWAEWTWTSGQAFWHVEENTPLEHQPFDIDTLFTYPNLTKKMLDNIHYFQKQPWIFTDRPQWLPFFFRTKSSASSKMVCLVVNFMSHLELFCLQVRSKND